MGPSDCLSVRHPCHAFTFACRASPLPEGCSSDRSLSTGEVKVDSLAGLLCMLVAPWCMLSSRPSLQVDRLGHGAADAGRHCQQT